MTDRAMLPLLLTGASGALGRVLARNLATAGWTLRLTDIAPFPDPVPERAAFTQADLAEGATMARLAEGCGTILHFGGVSVERPFHEVLGPNITGLYNIYEAARLAGARVVFASSNHTIGFHPRSERLDVDCAFRPDGYYRAIEGVRGVDGQPVLGQARGRERPCPHRLVPACAEGRPDAVDLPFV